MRATKQEVEYVVVQMLKADVKKNEVLEVLHNLFPSWKMEQLEAVYNHKYSNVIK